MKVTMEVTHEQRTRFRWDTEGWEWGVMRCWNMGLWGHGDTSCSPSASREFLAVNVRVLPRRTMGNENLSTTSQCNSDSSVSLSIIWGHWGDKG